MKLRVNGIGMPPPTDGAIRELVQVLKFRWILRVPRDQMLEQLNPVHRLSPSLWVGMTCSRSHVATQARHPVLDVEHSSEPLAMVSWFRSSRRATRSRSRQIPDNFTGWNIQPDSVVGVLRQEGSGNPHTALCPGLKPNRVGGLAECFGRLAWAELQLLRCGDDESGD